MVNLRFTNVRNRVEKEKLKNECKCCASHGIHMKSSGYHFETTNGKEVKMPFCGKCGYPNKSSKCNIYCKEVVNNTIAACHQYNCIEKMFYDSK